VAELGTAWAAPRRLGPDTGGRHLGSGRWLLHRLRLPGENAVRRVQSVRRRARWLRRSDRGEAGGVEPVGTRRWTGGGGRRLQTLDGGRRWSTVALCARHVLHQVEKMPDVWATAQGKEEANNWTPLKENSSFKIKPDFGSWLTINIYKGFKKSGKFSDVAWKIWNNFRYWRFISNSINFELELRFIFKFEFQTAGYLVTLC
jgi:hypothetical protein